MQIKVKPIIVLGRREGWFCRSDGSLEFVADGEALARKVAELSKELRQKLERSGALLEDAVVRNENDLAQLKRDALEADALLVYLIGVMSLQSLFQWGLPILAFSGQQTPMLALYAFGVERHSRAGTTIALDFQEIDEEIRLLEARKKLQTARIALFGFPPPIFSRWHHLPDLELAREKLGVDFSPVEVRELVAQLAMIDEGKAQKLGQRWVQEAGDVVEPSTSDVTDAARLFLAMSDILAQRKANAMAINCIELMTLKVPPPCYAMARLRDEGIHAACEADVSTLLTMMLLGYLADEPAFMGNIVGANPQSNTLMISHCVVPTRMAGFGQPPRRYTLRNYHGTHAGVTAHVELDIGQELTIARLARNMEKIMLLRGELVDCRDTTACRTTISARVSDVRNFVRCALGNHHAVVYGDHVGQTKALSDALGISAVEL
jgi:L-fucose isomerase-like protein